MRALQYQENCFGAILSQFYSSELYKLFHQRNYQYIFEVLSLSKAMLN